MSQPTPHRTPLRRVSQGSLHSLSRSSNFPDAPHGLGFLTPVLAELMDELQTLQVNTQGMMALEKSLIKFNESFASWLYVQDMASLTLDWTQVSSFVVWLVNFISCTGSSRLRDKRRLILQDRGLVCTT
jgi:DASH complex subunit DAM1